MNDKRTRFITTIFTLDRIMHSINHINWDNEDVSNLIKEYEKHYGLKLINLKEEILIIAEYNNIIWVYRIYYGSYKKQYKSLIEDDDRWQTIEKQIQFDLKTMGVDILKDKVLLSLKNKEYFEYKIKIEKQFKKYCI